MRVADVIAEFIWLCGTDTAFVMTGGGNRYITDAFAKEKRINKISCHHEQAAAMGAVAYAKYKNGIGCAVATTGCGGTNLITGALDAWQDSTACFFITGQCNTRELIKTAPYPVRQIGSQEADIVSMVSSIMKYAVTVMNAEDILYHLEKAKYLAVSGRKGPVWLDIPINVQYAEVEKNELRHFNPDELESNIKVNCTEDELDTITNYIKAAKRPLVIAGQGIHLANARKEFKEFIEMFHIPVVYTSLGVDILPFSHPLCIGKIGSRGTRAANFALQNADTIFVLGSRLSTGTTGYKYELFARNAAVIAIDIDENEHRKETVRVDKIINCDVIDFLQKMVLRKGDHYGQDWADICNQWKINYPVCQKEHYQDKDGISYYAFMEELSKVLAEDSVVIADAGSAFFIASQTLHLNYEKQRYITSGAQGEMGLSLPASVGVCMARNKKEVIAITGDGSLQMNLQELQTLVKNQLPIKLFVWSNDGYMSIREMMNGQFDGRVIGTDASSGLSMPNLEKIANAYGLKYIKLETIVDFNKVYEQIREYDGPLVCEVICKQKEGALIVPGSRKLDDGRIVDVPLEDMCPFLSKTEFEKNMIVTPLY